MRYNTARLIRCRVHNDVLFAPDEDRVMRVRDVIAFGRSTKVEIRRSRPRDANMENREAGVCSASSSVLISLMFVQRVIIYYRTRRTV